MDYKILNILGKNFASEAKVILEKIGKVDYRDISQGELERIVGGYHIIVLGLGLVMNKKVIDTAGNLSYIVSATTGLDHIDVEYAKKKGIKVISLRGETEFLNMITGTAELAFGLMIDLLRFAPHAFESVKNGNWDRELFRGRNLYGKTLGIIGLGRLGTWMAKYAKAFNMNVVACDPFVGQEYFENLGVKKVALNEMMKMIDILSIHVHLSEETKIMVNAKLIKLASRPIYIINTARGGIVNEADILACLQDGSLAGYACDVLENELKFVGEKAENPLIDYAKANKNCIIVPHIGGMTFESREATDIFIAKKLLNELSNKD